MNRGEHNRSNSAQTSVLLFFGETHKRGKPTLKWNGNSPSHHYIIKAKLKLTAPHVVPSPTGVSGSLILGERS
jgi:hypothetical protein